MMRRDAATPGSIEHASSGVATKSNSASTGVPWGWALFLLVLGSRLTVFVYAGSPLPYYDQWLAEFNNTLLTAAGGGDIGSMLLLPHNEHFPLVPKLLTLAGYFINGYWDVEFLAVVAAFARAFSATFAYRILTVGAQAPAGAIFAACVLVFAVPYSGYNQLCGLQVSFYLADLALLWSMHSVLRWASPWRSGFQLTLSLGLGLLSLGSALAIPAATLAVHGTKGGRRRGFWIAWAISVAMVLAYLSVAPKGAVPDTATRIYEFLSFFSALLAWPILNPVWGLAAASLFLVGMVRALRGPAHTSTALAAALGLGVFAGVNALFIAYARTPETLHMRHWETLAFLPLSLVAVVVLTVDRFPAPRYLLRLGGIAVALIYLGFFAALLTTTSIPYLHTAHVTRDQAIQHYRALLLSRDIRAQTDWLNDHLARRNYAFFDDSIQRFAIHPLVAHNIANAPLPSLALLGPDLIPARPPSFASRITRAVKYSGPFLLAAGLALTAVGARASTRRSRARAQGGFSSTD